MDIWHRLGRIIRILNLGTVIFFVLNVMLLLFIFCPYAITYESAMPILMTYIITVIISLSPVGEWALTVMAGAREIKRKDIKIRLIPLLEVVYNKAKEKTPSMVDTINLKIIHDQSPNAFAIGRRTICVTDGLLNLSDESIMAIFAHEVGHLAYGHSVIQLLIGGGNLFISGCLLLIKIVCWTVATLCGLIAGVVSKNFWIGALATLASSLPVAMIWLWTKFCMIFLMWSMRQNEYVADEYAYKLGFGTSLAMVLDDALCSPPENGLLKALYATHPHTDDRIAHLQDFGVDYSRYYAR